MRGFQARVQATGGAGRAARVRASALDRLLKPLHRWVWSSPRRRARKLIHFAATEADGGRDLARAAELTADPLLRQLYLRHARDEQRHAELFQQRGQTLLAGVGDAGAQVLEANWLAPGERGLDDIRVEREHDESLLAFLHLSEKAAAGRFALYREVLERDAATRDVFTEVLQDEAFHMNYTYSQLERIAPARRRARLWRARLGRLWKAYLRLAIALAGVLGTLLLLLQYFILLPPFAALAKRAARREPLGWTKVTAREPASLRSQY